jgi:hypothetical protein
MLKLLTNLEFVMRKDAQSDMNQFQYLGVLTLAPTFTDTIHCSRHVIVISDDLPKSNDFRIQLCLGTYNNRTMSSWLCLYNISTSPVSSKEFALGEYCTALSQMKRAPLLILPAKDPQL